jgi:alpha-ketoglutarate-dependent taurine dioxygenase
MPEYRRKDLDLSTRIFLGVEMLCPAEVRGWGRASELAEEYGISRSLLYQIKDRVFEALEAALKPKAVGRPAEVKNLVVDRDYLHKAIAVMPLLTGSVRSIQMGLALLFGVQRSVGHISQTLKAAGAAAERQNEGVRVPLPVLGEADEIFAGHQPCLTVVDGRSFLVLNLAAAESRDATHWGLTFLDLAAQGVVFQDLAADGARGIRTGLQDAELAVPLRPDLFHLLREGKRLANRLEKTAYKAVRTAEKVIRAEQEANQPTRRPGRPLKVELSAAEALQKETQAIATYDNFCWLLAEVHQALEPISNQHHLQDPQQAQQTLETAIELFQSLPGKKLADFAQQLQDYLDELLAPLRWLQETLAPWCQNLPADLEAWILASWRNGLHPLETIPTRWQRNATAIWDALALFHRSSSLAESLHSWLRPYLAIHRGMPDWLFPLLQLFWNHHVFSRGKRAGHSPLQLAGVEHVPSLASAFDSLFVNLTSA